MESKSGELSDCVRHTNGFTICDISGNNGKGKQKNVLRRVRKQDIGRSVTSYRYCSRLLQVLSFAMLGLGKYDRELSLNDGTAMIDFKLAIGRFVPQVRIHKVLDESTTGYWVAEQWEISTASSPRVAVATTSR